MKNLATFEKLLGPGCGSSHVSRNNSLSSWVGAETLRTHRGTKALSCPWFSDSRLGEGIAPL